MVREWKTSTIDLKAELTWMIVPSFEHIIVGEVSAFNILAARCSWSFNFPETASRGSNAEMWCAIVYAQAKVSLATIM